MIKPVLSFNAPIGGDGHWTHAGGYSVWGLTVGERDAQLALWERRDGVAAALPETAYVLHNIDAGTPHRLAHGFGFWRISDGDTIYLKTTEGARTHHTLALTTGAPDYRTDRIAWFCPSCGGELRTGEFDTRRFGLDAFWTWALGEARSFSAEPAQRRCASCGEVHPPAYGIDAGTDTTDERTTRAAW